jgi:hypothetical protein
MESATSAERLRREISKLAIGRGQRYPSELKARVVAWASSVRRCERVGWEKLGAAVGIHAETLRSWCTGRDSKAMRRVVVDEAREHVVVIVMPSGIRAELGLRDAMTLLAALG